MDSQVKTQEEIKFKIGKLFTKDKYISSNTVEQIKSLLRDVSSLKLLKTGGKNIIPQGNCVNLFNKINKFLKVNNIFILECGEIERFVPDVSGHGNNWVEKVFTKYKDIDDDVYEEARRFIRNIFKNNLMSF